MSGADLRGATGLDECVPLSIDVGHILEGEDARAWLIEAASGGR